jgi:hypothetical protein
MKGWPLLLSFACAFAPAAHAGFVVGKANVESAAMRELATALTQERFLEDVALELDKALVVKPKLTLRLAECGEANAYYDADTRTIDLCLELLTEMRESFASAYETEDEVDDAVAGAFVFFLFHEVGHALIDVLELPITGREEDAADQLAAWVLIDAGEGNKAVIDAATSFYGDGEGKVEVAETDFADEHGLDRQRYFNMVCWVYGSDPEANADLVADEWLPEDRAALCEGEYRLLDRSWTKLLEGHLK